jgi:uncharacterized protein YcfJ
LYVLLFTAITAPCVPAGEYRTFRDYAPVVKVEPVVATGYRRETRRVCPQPDRAVHTSAAVAPTIGDDIRRQMRSWEREHACRLVGEERPFERITGYRVTYSYQGRTSTTLMSRDPGKRVPVDISLSPLP